MERKQKKEVLRYASASRGRRASPQRDRDELDVAFLEASGAPPLPCALAFCFEDALRTSLD